MEELLRQEDGVACPGCSKKFTNWSSFVGHAPHCARISGHNVSSGHALIKEELKAIFHDVGIRYDSEEPRDCRTTVCPGCSLQMFQKQWEEHRDSCAACNRHTPTPRGSGPDIRIRDVDKLSTHACETPPEACLIDVTQVSSRCATNENKSMKDIFAQREKTKIDKYLKAILESKQELLVFAVNEDGQLNSDAERLLSYVASKPRSAPIEALRRRIQQAAQRAHGNALTNAIRQLHLNSSAIFCSAPISMEVRLEKIKSELEIINSNKEITPSTLPQHFANPVGPEASIALMRRVVSNQQETIRRQRASSEEASASDSANEPINSAFAKRASQWNPETASVEDLARWTLRIAQHNNPNAHTLSAEQRIQVARNAAHSDAAQQASIMIEAGREQQRTKARILDLEDDHSPIREMHSTGNKDLPGILDLFATNASSSEVTYRLSRFIAHGENHAKEGQLKPNFFVCKFIEYTQHVFSENLLALNANDYFSRSLYHRLFGMYDEALQRIRSKNPNLSKIANFFSIFNETAHPLQQDALRNIIRLYLLRCNYIGTNGRFIGNNSAPRNALPVQQLSQQNNNQQSATQTNVPENNAGDDAAPAKR
jgi:hypothetical protein